MWNHPENINRRVAFLQKPGELKKLQGSLTKRILSVLENKGGRTKY